MEEESKRTQRNNQYIICARNIIYHIIYTATYKNPSTDVNIIKIKKPINHDNELFSDKMINVLYNDKYMKYLISLMFNEFCKSVRLTLKDFEDIDEGSNKRKHGIAFNDIIQADGSTIVLESLVINDDDKLEEEEEETIINPRIVKKLILTMLMELPQTRVLSFILDKIKSKHFPDRMIREVLNASSCKLSKDKIPKEERIYYNYLRQDELKNSRYKDAADALYKLSCDSEYRRFRYTTSLNQNHDKTPLSLSMFHSMARYTEKIYAFSSSSALDLNLTNFTYDKPPHHITYDVVTFVRSGDTEIFDVRKINGEYLDCMSWEDRLKKLPNSHILNNYKKINLYKINTHRWLKEIELNSQNYVYIRTCALGLGTLFVNRNKGVCILNKRHKKTQKEHLYDGDVKVPESIHENYQRIEIKSIDLNTKSTLYSCNESMFD